MTNSNGATELLNSNSPSGGVTYAPSGNPNGDAAQATQSTSSRHPLIVVVNDRTEEHEPAIFLNEEICTQARAQLQNFISPLFDLRHLLDWSADVRLAVLSFIASLNNSCLVRSSGQGSAIDLFKAVIELIPVSGNIERSKAAINAAKLVAALKHADAVPLAVESLSARLNELGVRGYTVAALAKDIKQMVAALQPAHVATESASLLVHEIFDDAPGSAEAVVPVGWELNANGVKKLGEEDYAIPAPLLITRKLSDAIEGIEWRDIAWKQGGIWKRRLIPRSQMANARAIVELAGYGVPVTSNNAAEVVQFLSDFETFNGEQLPTSRVSLHMGWQGRDGEDGFLWGHELIGAQENLSRITFQGRDEGDVQLAAGFRAGGTLHAWNQTLSTIAYFPRVMLAVYASLAVPLLMILRSANFVLSYSGRTSVGKTTTLRIAASVWGCPDEREPDATIGTWDATRTWIERALAARTCLPLVLDDTKRARRPDDIAQTVYDVVSGRGRGRASLTGTQLTAAWTAVMIASGEAPLTSFSQDGGTRARVLDVWGSPFQEHNASTASVVNRINAGVLQNYGHAGPAFVAFLVQHRAEWDNWRQQYQQWREHYERRAGDNSAANRMAAHFAALSMAASLSHYALNLPWDHCGIPNEMWNELTTETAEADRALAAMQFVLNWAQGRPREFFTPGRCQDQEPSQGWVGRHNEGQYIGFLPHKVDEILTQGGFEPVPTRRLWLDRGWLLVTEGKPTYRARMGGSVNAYLVAVRWNVVREIMGEDEPDTMQTIGQRPVVGASVVGERQGNNQGTL